VEAEAGATDTRDMAAMVANKSTKPSTSTHS
jgi:hypothetical protein